MFESLRSLSDNQLLTNTDVIATQHRQLTLKLLVHLIEIERRKLYLKLGYGSMFIYCTTHLRLSEPAAARRIRTARCLARFPQLYELLESGEVNLMSVSLISKWLTKENADVLIARIRGRSKREIEAIIAELEPRSIIPPDSVRVFMVPAPAPHLAPSARPTVTGDSEKSPNSEMTMEPFSAIQFSARQEFMAKVERARALIWHQFPNPTFEQLFELGLDALISRRDPAERQKRREQRAPAARKTPVRAGKRYVAAAVRDEVFARDGFRCSYVGPDGRRCTATVALQVDHVLPVARGGAGNRENLRILCAEHNRLEASRIMSISGSPHYVRESRPDYLRATGWTVRATGRARRLRAGTGHPDDTARSPGLKDRSCTQTFSTRERVMH